MNRFKSLLIVVCFIVLSACSKSESPQVSSAKSPEQPAKQFSAQLEKVIQDHESRVAQVLANPTVLEAIKASNDKNSAITEAQIQELDGKWKGASLTDEFIRVHLTNPCAKELLSFQSANDGFVEIFIADKHGLNVCQTNKTSDYYQADEDWWISTYASGKGKSGHGEIEYDESARSESIPVFVPVKEPNSAETIGVAKAVIDLTAIKRML